MRPDRDADAAGVLHLVVGPWASGKTTLVPHLSRSLPQCVVFDWDAILPALSCVAAKDVYTDASTWDGLRETWVAIVTAVLSGGRDVVLCGPLRPHQVAADQIPAVRVRCAYLDWPDSVLSARLSARGVGEAAIDDELATAAALRESAYHRLQAKDREPRNLAEGVAAWVQSGRRSA